MSSYEVFHAACEREQSTPKKLVVICGLNRQSLKPFLITACDPGGGSGRYICGHDIKGQRLGFVICFVICYFVL